MRRDFMTLDINGGENRLLIPSNRAPAVDVDLDAEMFKINILGCDTRDTSCFLPKITENGQWLYVKQMDYNMGACNLWVMCHAGDTIENSPYSGMVLDAGLYPSTLNSIFLIAELNGAVSNWWRAAGLYSASW